MDKQINEQDCNTLVHLFSGTWVTKKKEYNISLVTTIYYDTELFEIYARSVVLLHLRIHSYMY